MGGIVCEDAACRRGGGHRSLTTRHGTEKTKAGYKGALKAGRKMAKR